MQQQTFTDESFEKFRKKTRKEQFLDEIERIIPWQELTVAIEPLYPNPQGAGPYRGAGKSDDGVWK